MVSKCRDAYLTMLQSNIGGLQFPKIRNNPKSVTPRFISVFFFCFPKKGSTEQLPTVLLLAFVQYDASQQDFFFLQSLQWSELHLLYAKYYNISTVKKSNSLK